MGKYLVNADHRQNAVKPSRADVDDRSVEPPTRSRRRELPAWLVPWDLVAARQALLRLILVAVATTGTSAVLRPAASRTGRILTDVFPCVIALIGAILLGLGARIPALLITVTPVFGLLMFVAMALVTHDSSAAIQIFLAMPILFCTAHLREALAYVVLVLTIGFQSWIVLANEPIHPALRDIAYTAAAYTSICVLLVIANRGQREAEAKLRHQASVDGLTGLVTRRVLDEAARSAIVGSTVGSDGTALIMMDVDKFKVINDTYGHPVGDDALNHIAEIIQQNARPDAVIGRIGGDEIAVLLPGCGYDAALIRAGQLVAAVQANPLELDNGESIQLGVSAGVAHVPLHAVGLRELYAAADEALYEAKRAGRDAVRMSRPDRPEASPLDGRRRHTEDPPPRIDLPGARGVTGGPASPERFRAEG
jgi:diguanylate cyclase (GGDEF)-like protein